MIKKRQRCSSRTLPCRSALESCTRTTVEISLAHDLVVVYLVIMQRIFELVHLSIYIISTSVRKLGARISYVNTSSSPHRTLMWGKILHGQRSRTPPKCLRFRNPGELSPTSSGQQPKGETRSESCRPHRNRHRLIPRGNK